MVLVVVVLELVVLVGFILVVVLVVLVLVVLMVDDLSICLYIYISPSIMGVLWEWSIYLYIYLSVYLSIYQLIYIHHESNGSNQISQSNNQSIN